MDISQLLQQQKDFFKTQKTKDVEFIKSCLIRLKNEVIKREDDILQALYNDFKKPKFEGIMTETALVLHDIDLFIKKIKKWSKPKRVRPNLLNFPSSAKIYNEPYGSVLIISPWNYPYQLALSPLIGAVSAGNSVVLKPSELTPNTSKILKEIITAVFEPKHVAVVEGGIPIAQELLAQRWDYIFFTGSVPVGKIVYQSASKHLTPVTLELGGKNPCIIDETANLKLTAKRLVWGKFLNAGQTCIAPDYLLVHKSVKNKFIEVFKSELEQCYGKNPQKSEDFTRIINEKNFDRLAKMLENEKILIGGITNKSDLYISPTLIDEPSLDSEVMKDEIFGSILAVISYENEDDIHKIITKYEKPLAFYVFSEQKKFAEKLIQKYSFGGGVINDTIIHFTNEKLPFGGVGHSGIGAYHGKQTFDLFTHKKGVVKRGTWFELPARFAPYKEKSTMIKKMIKWLS